jgi:hydroxyethylthiazole kinase-like uncharacterized protein yjeF
MSRSSEILTTAQARAADQAAMAAGTSGFTLLTRAGAGVAAAIAARFPVQPVLALCGPGLNGGDGYVAAADLAAQGWPVRIAALGPPGPEDAARARAAWGGPLEDLGAGLAGDLGGATLVIDALFGAGLARPLDPAVVKALTACEAAGAALAAVDLPSGLPGDAAKPLGYAPHAALTVTFHRKKPAHVLYPARAYCGDVVVVDIGIPAAASPEVKLWENGPDLWLDHFPWPSEDAHKQNRGQFGVVSGDRSHTGAARMAARAGLRFWSPRRGWRRSCCRASRPTVNSKRRRGPSTPC